MTTTILATNGSPLNVNSGEGALLTITLKDETETQVTAAALTSIVMTLTDQDGTVINSRTDTDVNGTGIGTVATDGTLSLRLQPADNPFNGSGANWTTEQHHVRLTWTWNDGVESRTGKETWNFNVVKTP